MSATFDIQAQRGVLCTHGARAIGLSGIHEEFSCGDRRINLQVDIASFRATPSVEKQAGQDHQGRYLGILDRVKHIKVQPLIPCIPSGPDHVNACKHRTEVFLWGQDEAA